MAISVNFYRATNDPTRGASLSAFGSAGSGVFVAGTWGPSATLAYVMPTATNVVTGLNITGSQFYVGNVSTFRDTQAASGAYTVQSSGAVAHFTGLTNGVLNNITTSMGPLTSGTSTGTGIFVLDENGVVSNYQSSWALVTTNAISGFGTAPYRQLNSDGASNLYCLGQSQVLKLALASATSGTWSALTAPSTVNGFLTDMLFMNSTNPIVVGRVPLLQADVAGDIVEFTNQLLAPIPAGPSLKIYAFDSNGNLSSSQTLATTGSPTYAAASVNQAVVTDPTNGTVRIFNNTAGTWSGPSQTFALAGAGKLGTSSDGVIALVASQSGNSVTGYKSTAGTWALQNSVTVSGATEAVLANDILGYASGASGVTVLNFTSAWAAGTTINLPVSAGSVAVDSYNSNSVYSCGTSAGSGFAFAINVSAATSTQQVWAGSADEVVYSHGYICVLDKTNSKVHTFANIGGTITAGAVSTLPTGTYTMLASGQVNRIYACGSNGWTVLGLNFPIGLTPYYIGYCWQWTGSAWNSTALGNSRPMALCTDGTYTYVVRQDNKLFKLSAAGAIQASYPQSIPVYTGQSPNTQLGINGMIVLGTTIYFSSAEGGGIGTITGY